MVVVACGTPVSTAAPIGAAAVLKTTADTEHVVVAAGRVIRRGTIAQTQVGVAGRSVAGSRPGWVIRVLGQRQEC